MSNEVFPELRGMTMQVVRAPIWKTIVRETVSGREFRASMMSYPRWRFDIQFEFLRAGVEQELQTIVGFFNRHGGKRSSFLFLDRAHYSVVDQAFGVGNGSQTAFQLARTFGGYTEPVVATVSNPAIKINGVTNTSWSISNGLVTFASAPGNGAVLTWTGQYYNRVRFNTDELDTEQFMYNLWKLNKVSLITDK